MGRSLDGDLPRPVLRSWLRRYLLRLIHLRPSGTWYCPVHSGVGNEDDYSCDFSGHDLTVEVCERRELFFRD